MQTIRYSKEKEVCGYVWPVLESFFHAGHNFLSDFGNFDVMNFLRRAVQIAILVTRGFFFF